MLNARRGAQTDLTPPPPTTKHQQQSQRQSNIKPLLVQSPPPPPPAAPPPPTTTTTHRQLHDVATAAAPLQCSTHRRCHRCPRALCLTSAAAQRHARNMACAGLDGGGWLTGFRWWRHRIMTIDRIRRPPHLDDRPWLLFGVVLLCLSPMDGSIGFLGVHLCVICMTCARVCVLC